MIRSEASDESSIFCHPFSIFPLSCKTDNLSTSILSLLRLNPIFTFHLNLSSSPICSLLTPSQPLWDLMFVLNALSALFTVLRAATLKTETLRRLKIAAAGFDPALELSSFSISWLRNDSQTSPNLLRVGDLLCIQLFQRQQIATPSH